jgi:hypothetical protein
MGKEYPKGYEYFRAKTKAAFLKNRDVQDPEMIRVLVARGKYMMKELDALYKLRKYRAMKQRYYDEPESMQDVEKNFDKRS